MRSRSIAAAVPAGRRPAAAKLVESLESRTLFAAGVFVAGDTLHVFGDSRAANEIVVDHGADGRSVDVSVSYTDPGGNVRSFTRNVTARRGIDAVRIFGGASDDLISAGHNGISGTPFALDVRVYAGAGADVVYTADGDDAVFGGDGADTIDAGAGDDHLFGGGDDDGIIGGLGDDAVWGGGGDDTLVGGDGDDLLVGIAGVNYLIGGGGDDRFVVSELSAQLGTDFDLVGGDVVNNVRSKGGQVGHLGHGGFGMLVSVVMKAGGWSLVGR